MRGWLGSPGPWDALCHPALRRAASPGEPGCCLCARTRLLLRCGTPGAGWSGVRGKGPGGAARAVSGAARKLGWPSGHRERGREGEAEGGSPCLPARECARAGFQALMGLALGVRPRHVFLHSFRTELRIGKSHQTVTASLAAKWCAPINPPKDTSSILLSLSCRCPAPPLYARLYARLLGATRVDSRFSLSLNFGGPSSPLWLSRVNFLKCRSHPVTP